MLNQFSSSRGNIIMKSFNSTNLPENQEYGYSTLIKNFIIAAVLSLLVLIGLFIYNISILNKFNREQGEHNLFMEKKLADLEISLTETKTLIDSLFFSQKELIINENQAIKDRQNSISEYLRYIVNTKLDRVIGNILIIDNHIGQIEQVYCTLLDEQKKKTLVNLYNEETILDHLRNAEIFFYDGKYGQAYNEYLIVSGEQTENLNVQFYKYYSLFLRNKEDQNQYRFIKNGLTGLNQSGYNRIEIAETLEYIAAKESHLNRSFYKE